MNSSKKTWFVVLVGVLAFVGFRYLSVHNVQTVESREHDFADVEAAEQLPLSDLESTDKTVENKVTVNEAAQQLDSASQTELTESKRANSENSEIVKKPYDSDWCDGGVELSDNDIILAQTELKDWFTLIGKVAVKGYEGAPSHELSNYVAPYESLSYEELKALALQGDKWAMVAFVQDHRGSYPDGDKLRKQVANELLVQGGAYYAIDHLVGVSIISAQININQNKNDLVKENITDALAYAYWGLEHFNGAGMRSFLVVIAHEDFKTKFPLESILADSASKINDKVAKLTNRINEQRALRGIDFPEPPVVAKNVFAGDVAFWQHINETQLDLLRSLDIPTNSRIKITPCVNKHLASWLEYESKKINNAAATRAR